MHRLAELAFGIVFIVLISVVFNSDGRATTQAMPLLVVVPTPGPGAMTIYAVTNPNNAGITVQHNITNTLSFNIQLTSYVPANTTVEYHVRDMPNVPSPFNGSMTLQSDLPFSSSIIGYDYPGSPVATPTVPTQPTGLDFRAFLPVVSRGSSW